jgi:hypothetical protein
MRTSPGTIPLTTPNGGPGKNPQNLPVVTGDERRASGHIWTGRVSAEWMLNDIAGGVPKDDECPADDVGGRREVKCVRGLRQRIYLLGSLSPFD